jgi:hypothetical protein
LKYYTDPHESVKVTLLIQVAAFSSVMIYILLIPFDVFATVRKYDYIFSYTVPITNEKHVITVYELYFFMYVVMIFMTFIGLPFSYFYAQSVQEEDDMMAADAGTSTEGQPEAKLNLGRGMDSSESSDDDTGAEKGDDKAMLETKDADAEGKQDIDME